GGDLLRKPAGVARATAPLRRGIGRPARAERRFGGSSSTTSIRRAEATRERIPGAEKAKRRLEAPRGAQERGPRRPERLPLRERPFSTRALTAPLRAAADLPRWRARSRRCAGLPTGRARSDGSRGERCPPQ